MSETITSIADNLQRLADVTDAIGDTIAEMGGTVGQYDRLEQYPNDILTIPTNVGEQTVTDTNTVNFVSNGDNLLDCNIKGNMVQNGNPSPTNIIYPQEFGDISANLYNKDAADTTDGYISGYFLNSAGNTYVPDSAASACITEYIPIESNQTYSQSDFYIGSSGTPSMCFYDNNKIFIEGISVLNNTTFTTPVNASFIRFSRNTINTTSMFNIGSTTIPYEPYGQYKIPISSGGTITPVYLGQVKTKRQICRFVLTGTENVTRLASGSSNLYLISPPYDPYYSNTATGLVSNSYVPRYNNNDTSCYFSNATPSRIVAVDNRFTTADDFKNYCAQQYLSGNPVIFWYVLAEPTTGIVNEPLRKIGDYADSVSAANIPTTSGQTKLTVDTTLEPSEIYIKYRYIENIKLLGTKAITENGVYNASTDNLDGYSSVDINVPIPTYINTTIEAVNDSLLESLEGNL